MKDASMESTHHQDIKEEDVEFFINYIDSDKDGKVSY